MGQVWRPGLEWCDRRAFSAVPPWIFILFLMVLVLLVFNPSAEDYIWTKTLRRPAWMVGVQVWQPLLWLVILVGIYLSALRSWSSRASWSLLAAYGVLLLLRQLTTWLLCRTRRLDVGALAGLASWMFAVALALGLASSIPEAVPGLLPFLLWTPVETWVTWRMQRLNS